MARLVAALAAAAALGALALAWTVRGPAVLRRPPALPARGASPERLRADVHWLTVDAAPRGYRHPDRLDAIAREIGARFAAAGLAVEEQQYALAEGTYRNVVGSRAGEDAAAGVVIVGAHYDAFGDLPGADDNASGVAVLLELARTLPAAPARRGLMLVAFSTEEPPFFATEDQGSARFAEKLLADGTDVHLMVSLDLVGMFSDAPGSQGYDPAVIGLLYPDRGNFLAVVGDLGAGPWIREVKRGLLRQPTLPIVSFRAPAALPGVHWSDHLPFRRRGMPGVLVTDTAFLRNGNYHRRTDTEDTLDYGRMAQVVEGMHGVLVDAGASGS